MMKRIAADVNVKSFLRMLRAMRATGRIYAMLAAASLCFLLATGLIGMAQTKWTQSPLSKMVGVAEMISASFFLDMLEMEIPNFQGQPGNSAFSAKNTTAFLLKYLTGTYPGDPKSMLASELPGMRSDFSTLLYAGKATLEGDQPADFMPPAELFRNNREPENGASSGSVPPGSTQPGSAPNGGQQEPNPGTPVARQSEQSNKPRILIYHSHNRESFLPELKAKGITKPDLAYDQETNITLVGKRLKQSIEKFGIPVLHETTDYPTAVSGFNYAKSYAYSATTVKEAIAKYNGFDMIFDIHRDALSRDKTTATINGKAYAQVYFVVGKKNPNWEKNSEFANRIHTQLEAKYPGISRGIFGKASSGNGEYNQSISPNSILVEIGGPYNSLEEMYRTADLLGDIIAEMYKSGTKAGSDIPVPANYS